MIISCCHTIKFGVNIDPHSCSLVPLEQIVSDGVATIICNISLSPCDNHLLRVNVCNWNHWINDLRNWVCSYLKRATASSEAYSILGTDLVILIGAWLKYCSCSKCVSEGSNECWWCWIVCYCEPVIDCDSFTLIPLHMIKVNWISSCVGIESDRSPLYLYWVRINWDQSWSIHPYRCLVCGNWESSTGSFTNAILCANFIHLCGSISKSSTRCQSMVVWIDHYLGSWVIRQSEPIICSNAFTLVPVDMIEIYFISTSISVESNCFPLNCNWPRIDRYWSWCIHPYRYLICSNWESSTGSFTNAILCTNFVCLCRSAWKDCSSC